MKQRGKGLGWALMTQGKEMMLLDVRVQKVRVLGSISLYGLAEPAADEVGVVLRVLAQLIGAEGRDRCS